jgi:hypothetical protein
MERFLSFAQTVVFGKRPLVVVLFALVTAVMVVFSAQLDVDAGFKKQLPLEHPYMQTFLDHEQQFGGANRLLVALVAKDGDMFDAEYFKALESLTREVSYLKGVNQSATSSIFTPDVRFIEIVEGGFAGGNVIPANFAPQSDNYDPSETEFERIRANIVKANVVGRLVAEDFDAAMVWTELLENDPASGEKIDYREVAEELEALRERFTTDEHTVHIIGFAQIVGDITEGAKSVVAFFGIAIVITAILLFMYSGSWRLAALPLICSFIAVIWQLGSLKMMGFGIDPMNILTPFLVLAIGVSHGVQMINSWNDEMVFNRDGQGEVTSLQAARRTFRRLAVPGAIALASDTVGFLTILLIDIRIIQELAITASVGVAVIILTNLILLPVLLSYVRVKDIEAYRAKLSTKLDKGAGLWSFLAGFTRTGRAAATIVVALALLSFGLWKGQEMQIGDSQRGVPELRENSRYNTDARLISDKFSLGVDQISIIAESHPNACTENHEVMQTMDDLAWEILNLEGVQQVVTLPRVAKVINAGWNEGNPKWRVLTRNKFIMRQNLQNVETDTGLLNRDCSAMPVIVFTEDHRAETINRVVGAVETFQANNTNPDVTFRLATGNVGVMAATNDVVQAAQTPILAYVYLAIIVLCLLTFRSIAATICIVAPLAVVSALAYALMAYMGIGLKVNTLPVVALGVGIGVDYGIYIYTRMHGYLRHGSSLEEAYCKALRMTGKPVLFTAVTLAVGVSTWLFSELKFQADMGVLLTFMFLLNMVGAILLLPALARFLLPRKLRQGTSSQ